MKQEQQVHIQKSKDALSYYRQMQRLYAASCGGYLGIPSWTAYSTGTRL